MSTSPRPILRKCPIVGNHFRSPDERATFKELRAGDQIFLEPEPTNEVDEFAIKVLAQGLGVRRHVGYVPAISSAAVLMLGEFASGEFIAIVAEDGKSFNLYLYPEA